MNEKIAEVVEKFREAKKAYEDKQSARALLQGRKVILEQLREAQELVLAESKDKEAAAVDACARGEISKVEYSAVVKYRVDSERELAETVKFIESMEGQLNTLDAENFTGQGQIPQDTLTISRQAVYKVLFEDLVSDISTSSLSQIRRAYVCFSLSGGYSDWKSFLSNFLRLTEPNEMEGVALRQSLEEILERADRV
jgi:hypothetical protein